MRKKALNNAFLKNGEEYIFNHNLLYYKVKFILKILIIYFMNIYLLAFLLASIRYISIVIKKFHKFVIIQNLFSCLFF